LKEKKCEICGQDEEWMGKKLIFVLDHINGINDDNRLENLRIVCPNCNVTLDTHGAKNIKNNYGFYNGNYYCKCGNKKDRQSKRCKKCADLKQRKVERPDKETLLKDIEELGYKGTGRKYGVSDNAIRKWLK